MSEYLKGQKAWLDEECSWGEADKKHPHFRAGFNNAAKLYPNRRPKIKVRSQAEIIKNQNMVKCQSCGAKFEIDVLLFDEDFLTNKKCFNCGSEFPLTIKSSNTKVINSNGNS